MQNTISGYKSVLVSDGIRSSALATPEKTALAESERVLSYKELVWRINRVADGLHSKMAMQKHDHIALMSPNCLEFIEIVCGAADAGLATAMINPRLTAHEAAYICNDSKAKILFVHHSLRELMATVKLESVATIIVIGDGYEEWLLENKQEQPDIQIEETDIFAIPYTAGTTGQPKGVLLPHRSRVLTFFAMAVEYGCYSSEDRSLAIAPLFHGAGFAFALAPVFFGGFCEILPKFDPEQVLKKLSENKITNTFMVPTHFNAIFALPEETRSSHQFPEFHTLISNAAPLPQKTKERIVEYFGEGKLNECYGSTEGGIVCNLKPPDQLRKLKCVGKAFPCTGLKLLIKWEKPLKKTKSANCIAVHLFYSAVIGECLRKPTHH
ncbi:MAG: AMP-binding protein [Gammaproteobacteria bacterium]|nr:AMP-binding protein [Gammaproteobacteria bacterium]